jgi:signal transduction histidine kinase
MPWLLYLRLITLTAGTLLPFFWMVVILGYRRQRNFERVFFFLCLALTCFFGCSLLALNAQLFYITPPGELLRFAWAFLCLGLFLIPPLLIHLHVEYGSLRELIRTPTGKLLWLAIAWFPAAGLTWGLWRVLRLSGNFDFERPTHTLGMTFQGWLIVSMVIAAIWQQRFHSCAPDNEQRAFHRAMVEVLAVLAGLLLMVFWGQRTYGRSWADGLDSVVLSLALIPFAVLILNVRRLNFLQIGRQRNLIYAVFSVFLALLYLSFVRRAGQWLEPYLPPEATAALLLFLPVVFFEPLQHMIRGLLRQTAQSEMDRAQKLMGPINEVARHGDLEELRTFCEGWIGEQLQLAEAHLVLGPGTLARGDSRGRHIPSEDTFEIRRGNQITGALRVRSHGAVVSGETFAALEFVAEQLPGAFDLCRLIGEKLQLERELAERERLALIGQMAASISHNLKNPLGSIKTILQVQLESPELPSALRGETQMVLDEINRLSSKLNQLLQYSRPGARVAAGESRCNLTEVLQNVVNVMRPEAEKRQVALELQAANNEDWVAASGEAVNDILTNVILNAIESAPARGHVRVDLRETARDCEITVEDDGPGISLENKEKILRPFFTTKPQGTGLGLAIVQKRLEECNGAMELTSPVRNGNGTRFKIVFRTGPETVQVGKA